MNKFLILFFMFCSTHLIADEPTFIYLVDTNKFSTGYSSVDNLGYKYKEHSIPVKWGSLLFVPNTNYAILTVTPKNGIEKNTLSLLESNNSIKKLNQRELKKDHNGRIHVETFIYNQYPDDLNKDWKEVWKSTP